MTMIINSQKKPNIEASLTDAFSFTQILIRMQIIPVNDDKTKKDFLKVPQLIYKDDENWICPLEQDIEQTFDPKKNHFFEHGICTRWILKNDANQLIGRVAAFVNHKKAHQYDIPTGGMGFFECIDNTDAAFLLFDTAKEWLKAQGMQAMEGPINFGENDSFWGLLVEGFTPIIRLITTTYLRLMALKPPTSKLLTI
jgi:hypothetical protein